MKVYRIKKFTQEFPKRSAKDPVIRTVDTLKVAQIISIELNNQGDARYYVEEINVL